MKEAGLDKCPAVVCGDYVGGHPEVDIKIPNVKVLKKDDTLILLRINAVTQVPDTTAQIPLSDIKNITVEDSSTIERKITVGRIFLVGVFALGWRKKKKNELAFVTVEWSDGKFAHDTLFCFEGHDAMNKANTCRNALIKLCR